MSAPRPAVFLDRDGVLNEIVEREGQPASPRSIDEFRLAADIDAVNRLGQAGFLVFIITNQPDIARGLVTQETVAAMFDAIRARVHIDDVRVCPHRDEDGCGCRKPKPGMIFDLARHWHLDVRASWVLGDMWRDMDAARAGGARGVLLERTYNEGVAADFAAASLSDAVDCVLTGGERR